VTSRLSPVWLVLIGILSVQFGAGIAKSLFDEVPPTVIVWLRLATSAVVLTLVARPLLRRRTRHDWLVVAGLGASLGIMNWAIYQSFARIPLGVAVTIEFIGPLGVAVAGSRRLVDGLWVLLAGAGVVLLMGGLGGGGLDPFGAALAGLAGLGWASYILVSQRVGKVVPGGAGLSAAMAIAAVALLPVGVASAGTTLLHPHLLLTGAAIGLLSSALPYALEFAALRRLPAKVFGVLMSLEPAAAAVAGLIVLHETLVPRELAGIALVVLASAGSTRSAREKT
jgi:inner membrane transporter RhtA